MKLVIGLWLCCWVSGALAQRGVYATQAELLSEYLPAATQHSLWLQESQRTIAEAIWQRKLPLRISYHQQGDTSLWVMREIGKEQPITIGVIVAANKINAIKVMEYRESRGGEIRHNFFTRQFKQLGLAADQQLDKPIDGISGATLSVRAMKKIARLSLYLASQIAAPVSPSTTRPSTVKP
jgi:hypothetical protein